MILQVACVLCSPVLINSGDAQAPGRYVCNADIGLPWRGEVQSLVCLVWQGAVADWQQAAVTQPPFAAPISPAQQSADAMLQWCQAPPSHHGA